MRRERRIAIRFLLIFVTVAGAMYVTGELLSRAFDAGRGDSPAEQSP